MAIKAPRATRHLTNKTVSGDNFDKSLHFPTRRRNMVRINKTKDSCELQGGRIQTKTLKSCCGFKSAPTKHIRHRINCFNGYFFSHFFVVSYWSCLQKPQKSGNSRQPESLFIFLGFKLNLKSNINACVIYYKLAMVYIENDAKAAPKPPSYSCMLL